MNTTNILYTVLAVVVLCFIASFLLAPTTNDILYTVLDDSSIESHITKSYLDNGNLIIDIYNPNCEIVKVKPATIEHHVTADMNSVKIFNYTNQKFNIVVGNSSDVYLFGADAKKEYDDKNKTITILNDTSKTKMMTAKLVSSVPDLTTFIEVFEITNFELYSPDKDVDFKARSELHKGNENIYNTKWFVEKNISYVVNVTDYKIVQVKEEIHNNKTGKNETVLVNKTVVSGHHDETHYKNVWVGYDLYDKQLSKNTVQKIKVVYHKKPELGIVQIKTVPVFRGVECDELTWWNTSWDTRVQLNVNNSTVALTDYQLMKNITYDSDMNANFSDLRFMNESGTLIPYWIESKTDSSTADIWLKIPSISTTEGAKVWMYYNNPNASNVSNGDDTFIQWHGAASSDYLDSFDVVPSNIIVEGKVRVLESTHIVLFGLSNTATGTDDYMSIYSHSSTNLIKNQCKNDGASSLTSESPSFTSNTWYKIKQSYDGSTMIGYYNGNQIGTTLTTNIPNENMGLWVYSPTGTGEQEYLLVRKYTVTEPTWGADGAEEDQFSIASYAPSTPLNKLNGELQYFNVTTDVNCQCRWYINGTLKQTNTTQQTDHNYTNTSLEVGYFNFSAVVNTSGGMTDMQTWWVTVDSAATYKPPEPTNLANTTGNFWVNHTWQADGGNVTDGYNVSVNGAWYNRTYAWYNETYSAHDWQNISVWAWNNSGVGTLSD